MSFEDRLWLCCVSALGWGLGLTQHHPGAFSSLLPPLLQKQILLKKRTQHICASSLITDRCLFGPVIVLVSFFSFILNCRFAGLCFPVQSRTIRVWLKPLLVRGTSLLPKATSLMQKNTSWRCFVRCFYIKQFSSIVSVCQGEIKCIYFPVCFREEFFAGCGGFSHMAVDGHGGWNPHGRASEQQPVLPGGLQLLALPGADIKGSFSKCRVNHGLIPEREGGEALGAHPWAFSAVPFTQVQVCSFILYGCLWGGDKPPGASGFVEGSGFFFYLCSPQWQLLESWSRR